MGDTFVLVDERMAPVMTFAAIVHEMTHYLQWHHGTWKGTPASRCANEAEAFAVSNVVLRGLSRPGDVVDWAAMAPYYGCSE